MSVNRLRCPVDAKVLAVHRHDGVELQVCRHCHGVWLTREQLATCSVKRETVPSKSRSKLDASRSNATAKRVCSQCNVPLKAQIVESVEIDLCSRCGGLWLDAGEFDAVHQWYVTGTAVSPGAARSKKNRLADVADGVSQAGDPIVSGLGEVVEFLCKCAFEGL